MRQLDRYVLRNFLEPFFICFFGFISILLIFDLYDNGPDFIEKKVKLKYIAAFYATQLPAMVLWALPAGLVLALLFSLSRMSRHNEIISMLTAGVSLGRIILPLVGVGMLATAFCFWLNNSLAPHAEAAKKMMLVEITQGARRAASRETIGGHLFRNRQENRTWYVRELRPGNVRPLIGDNRKNKDEDKSSNAPKLDYVEILQQDDEGNIRKKWYAERAMHDPRSGNWILYDGMYLEYAEDGSIAKRDSFAGKPYLVELRNKEGQLTGWKETPWRIASSRLQAQNLSIEELHEYLRNNADFTPASLAPFRTNLADRWAFPWSCVVLIFIAAPLGIVYNRRGVLAAVASALLLFVGTILLRSFLLALGKGARLDPWVAAWAPNIGFLTIGLILLWFRSTNRDFSLGSLWRVLTFRHG